MLAPLLGLVAALAPLASALPAASPLTTSPPTPVGKRQLLGALSSELGVIASLESGIITDIGQKVAATALLSELKAIVPTATPTNAEQALSALSAAFATQTPAGFVDAAAIVLENSLSPTNAAGVLEALELFDGINSDNNPNNPTPSTAVYPKKLPCDAPYSVTEAELRRQIYIPSSFTYGQKPPVILMPGTGGRGGQNFLGNFEVLLADVDYADLVWVNPTGFMLADAQYNAELAAYAMNYISAISNNVNVSIIGWSQGNIAAHWATKYWPSTRLITSDHIAISPDYHGTLMVDLIDPGNTIAYSPSLLQQKYLSNFITALLSNGGDSAYVPTTNIYSGTYDEIVEPQQGSNASAILLDAHNVGVTNAQVQTVCGADSPAGFFQDHESMLASSLSAALAIDALTHAGPGLVSRIDLTSVCQDFIAPGLSFENFLETEEDILIAGLEVLTFYEAMVEEPAVSAYALKSPTNCATKAASTLKTSTKTTSAKTTSAKTTSAKTTSTKTTSVKATSTKTTSAKTTAKAVSTASTKTKKVKASTTSSTTAAGLGVTVSVGL